MGYQRLHVPSRNQPEAADARPSPRIVAPLVPATAPKTLVPARFHHNIADIPIQRTLLSGGAASDAATILGEAQLTDAERFGVWNMNDEVTAWEAIASPISITRNGAGTLDVTLDGAAIAGSPFATLRLAVAALRPLIFTALADDTARYTLAAAASNKIRKASGENPFTAYSGGKTVATAVEEAIVALDVTGSVSVAHSRHDFQPAGADVKNLQVQLGGSTGNYRVGQGDTSSTLVVVAKTVWDAQVVNASRWKKVLQAAHRQSFANTERIDLTAPA